MTDTLPPELCIGCTLCLSDLFNRVPAHEVNKSEATEPEPEV
ncbi:hypothetical protein SPONN_24 [uncultured Candidatus Thioglobus sp.]|nr:hypothetical protein SPONN_24 [uncultured Candidatus Thioglobus sp.]